MAHVALVSKDLAGGGTQRTAVTLATGFLERGHRVDMLLRQRLMAWPRDVPEDLRIVGLDARQAGACTLGRLALRSVPLLAAGCGWFSLVRRAPEHVGTALCLAAYLDRERPDAVIAFGRGPRWWALGAKSVARHSARTVVAYGSARKHLVTDAVDRALLPTADTIVVVSRGLRTVLAERLGRAGGVQVRLCYAPIVGPALHRKAAEPVDHPWFDEPGPVCLAVGRYSQSKDYPTLLRALAAMDRPAKLIVLGGGNVEFLHGLRSLSADLGIADRVDFAGFVENPYAFMARADLFVLSSRWEGMPQALAQAMAIGCKLVATDCPTGPSELLDGGKYGRLVPVGDSRALAAAIDRELDTQRDSDALRARAAELFDRRAGIDRYERALGVPARVT